MIVFINWRGYRVVKPEAMTFAQFSMLQAFSGLDMNDPKNQNGIAACVLVPVFGSWSTKSYERLNKDLLHVRISKVAKILTFFLSILEQSEVNSK
jgi:hypothetical protein